MDHILHPTDFTEASLTAFYHALKAGLVSRARLTLLHDKGSEPVDFSAFPGIRETLERWGVLPPGSPQSAVTGLGMNVRKVVTNHTSPVKGVLAYLKKHPIDLIVLATHQHAGRVAWRRHSVAEPVAWKSGQATLFIPEGSDGFVSAADGTVSLTSVLVPVAAAPHPQAEIEAAARLVRRFGCPSGIFTLLHVGDSWSIPEVDLPEIPGWDWRTVTRTGEIAHGIVDTACEHEAGLVVMATSGKRGFLHALRGSHTEQVLRQVSVPLLAVPEGLRDGASPEE